MSRLGKIKQALRTLASKLRGRLRKPDKPKLPPRKISLPKKKAGEKPKPKYGILYRVWYTRYCDNQTIGRQYEMIYQIKEDNKPDPNYAIDQFYTQHAELTECTPAGQYCIDCYDYVEKVEVVRVEKLESPEAPEEG